MSCNYFVSQMVYYLILLLKHIYSFVHVINYVLIKLISKVSILIAFSFFSFYSHKDDPMTDGCDRIPSPGITAEG